MPTPIGIETSGQGCFDITGRVQAELRASGESAGIVHLFVQHTSASLTIQENADPDVMRDLVDWLARIAPDDGPYRHVAEGSDDMPAHLKSVMTSTSLTVPFENGKLLLGTWQGIYLLEHRRAPHRRRVIVSLIPSL